MTLRTWIILCCVIFGLVGCFVASQSYLNYSKGRAIELSEIATANFEVNYLNCLNKVFLGIEKGTGVVKYYSYSYVNDQPKDCNDSPESPIKGVQIINGVMFWTAG